MIEKTGSSLTSSRYAHRIKITFLTTYFTIINYDKSNELAESLLGREAA